jgi:serine protease inhibitor
MNKHLTAVGLVITAALALAACGTEGQQAPPATSDQELEAGLQARSAALRALDSPGVTLDASDRVWADPTLATLRSYLNAVATGYDAGVWLPYRGGKLAMVALLPPAGAGTCAMPATSALAGMTARLAGPGSAGWTARDIALPRVSIHDQISLKGLLSGLGMGVAFTPAADFSGLSPQACCIGLVEHAATLKVGEQGTGASAATAVGIVPSAARLQIPAVAFDRPYLMLVTDSATGEPLFLARVANPAAD